MNDQDIKDLIKNDIWMMKVLRIVKDLSLPESWVAAGFVRNKVWDTLHGFKKHELSDVDVIYFDPMDISEEREKQIEHLLLETAPDIPWSVKNQARMHIINGEEPYTSTEDAVSRWVETPTCIGARLNDKNEIELLTPYGIGDLVKLIVRPSPRFNRDLQIFKDRIENKLWRQKWPKLKVIYSND
jgi:uncharacterized protein